MSTVILVDMACGAVERHRMTCVAENELLRAVQCKQWSAVRELEKVVRTCSCGCDAEPVDPDVRCSFEGPVDVELAADDLRFGDWTCPRCCAAHIDVEV